jgi:ABC-type oligopeptide transport system substrate-binding subunit
MRSKKLRRMIGVFAIAALAATACGGDDDDTAAEDPAATETSTAEATATDDGTSTAAAGDYDWSDVNRRQAVSQAIDREQITNVIFNGARTPADDFWPSTFVGYRGDYCSNLEFNPEQAATLWEEAGGDAGPINFWFNSGSGHEDWIEAVANMLQENLGVGEVTFESLEFADYLDKLDNAEVDGPFRLGWLMDYPSPGNFLSPIHVTAGSSNHTGYSNEEFDELVAAGDALPLEDAIDEYQQAADILCEDLPVAPMFFGLLQGVHSENVANVEFNPFEALEVTRVEDVDGDGSVSMYVCEPQNALYGQMTNETCGSEVVNGLFKGLADLDPESGEVDYSRGVAESIESDDGGQNWTITLKDGWTFHNGEPVTAQSFADAWEWAAYGPNAAQNNYFIQLPGIVGYDAMQPELDDEGNVTAEPETDTLEGLNVVDDLTLEVELQEPFPQFPLVMLYNAYNPLPEAFFDDPETFGEAPIGNGPFMMDGTWEHDVQIATTAYPEYAGEAPQIDALTYKIYSQDTTGYNDVRSGALDIIDTIPVPEIPNAKDEFGDRYFEQATSSFNYLGFPIDLELAASWHEG